jgi:hypothetical protein
MGQETITYLTNIIIGVILAGLLTHSWFRQDRPASMRYWVLSALVMTAADVLFALRPELPRWIGRLAPTLLVTLGHITLCMGAQRTAHQPRTWRVLAGLAAVHTAVLIGFLFVGSPPTGAW